MYGFNQKIGQLAFPTENTGGFPAERPYSDATAQAMDEEAKLMIDVAYARTVALMVERKDEVMRLAELLLLKETINHDDIVTTIGFRPFTADPQYAAYISNALGDRSKMEQKAKSDAEAADKKVNEDTAPPNLSPI